MPQVDPEDDSGDEPLPSSVGFFGWDDDGTAWSIGGGELPEPPSTG